MDKNEIFILNSEIQIRREAAKLRAAYLRDLFAKLGQRLSASTGRRNTPKNGQKIGNTVGGATA